MRKTFLISLSAISLMLAIFLVLKPVLGNQNPSSPTAKSLFSKEADAAFVSSLGSNVDLNSGITMDRSTPAISNQANYINFAVFNHTEESIVFPDQGFGIVIFKYNNTKRDWERLQLRYVPLRETTILPPKLETWNTNIHNNWSVLEDETLAFGSERIRVYISGKGQTTKIVYAAYMDVPIDLSP